MMFFFAPGMNRLVGLARAGSLPRHSRTAAVETPAFLDAMSRAVQGVAIVSTDGPGGRFGITVSSVVSASADPPLVMASIHRRSPASAAVVRNGRFCVNLLAARHRNLADLFAGRPGPGPGSPYDFGLAAWIDGDHGSPVLKDAVASLECVVHRTLRAGTHRVILGRCLGVATSDGPPLLYSGRRYGVPITWPRPDPAARAGEEGARPSITPPRDPSGSTRRQPTSTSRNMP